MVFLDVGVGDRGSCRWPRSWSGRCLAVCATAFVDGRGSRLAAGRTPRAGAGVPAASGSRSWCRRRGCRARRWRPPSNSAQRSSDAAIGRPRSGSCQVPTNQTTEQTFETESRMLLTATVRRYSPCGTRWATDRGIWGPAMPRSARSGAAVAVARFRGEAQTPTRSRSLPSLLSCCAARSALR